MSQPIRSGPKQDDAEQTAEQMLGILSEQMDTVVQEILAFQSDAQQYLPEAQRKRLAHLVTLLEETHSAL